MKKYFYAKVRVSGTGKSSSLKNVLVEADDYGMAEKIIEDYGIEGYLQIEDMCLSVFKAVYQTYLERVYNVTLEINDGREIRILVGASEERFLKENVYGWALGADWVEWYDEKFNYWEADVNYVLRDESGMLEKF